MKNYSDIYVSVLMCVSNEKEEWINAAILSILKQTHVNFEFLIINDNPIRELNCEILNYYKQKDKRIFIYKNDINLGLAASLNFGIKNSSGKYVIRMDADDISLKNRIEEQVRFMEENVEVGVAGSYFRLIGDKPWYSKLITRKGKTNFQAAKCQLIFGPCVLHPSVIIRKNLIVNFLYNESFLKAQDYELWSRLSNVSKITNIPKVLHLWRISNEQSSIRNRDEQILNSVLVHKNVIKNYTGNYPNEKDILAYVKIIKNINNDYSDLELIEEYLIKIIKLCETNDLIDNNLLKNECAIVWADVCLKSSLGWKSVIIYSNSKLASAKSIKFSHFIYLMRKIFK